ncbi:MAG: right-handed parallel beta-helix repeat-containing protein [Sedimentisphaerales bacterium]|nr:right-handed parallel beta-helix repeat-containing protein [Sedimentisphaerales bacterium]
MRNLGGAPLVTDCTFTGNSAVHGGGIYSYCSSTPTVDGCTFTGNSADYGGGINNNASDATVLNSTFTDNVTLRGGGIYNTYSTPTINNCTFSSNSADCGGGMNNENSDPNVTNCVFNANTVSEYGGGMRNFGSNATVTDCAFSGNTANEYGGGMYNNDNEPMITNCSFIGNSAHDGGGMYNYRSNPTVTNCIFSSNAADLFGGGMYTRYDNLTITNCSFSTNASGWFGGGMYNQEVDPTVTNCILWGNTAVSSGSQLFNGGTSSTPVISYSDIEDCGGSGAGWNSALGTDGGGNIDADPLFVDADGIGENNLRLHAGSPCIDAGDNSAISETTDRDGNPRKVNDPATTDTGSGTAPIVDMGAYEFLQAIAKLMRGQSATLIPNGQSGPPTKDAQVYFENISGPILLQSLVRVRQYNTDLHYSSYAFSFMGITLMVETTLADGRFFATIKIPFNKVDLGGNNWKLFDLRYWNGNTWTLAVRGNTQDSPGHLGPAGDRFVDEAPTIPPLSSDLGDYGVYWNPMTEKGFVWANVDHTTDFAGVWLLGDFEPDYDVDLSDLSVFVMWWNASCGMPDYCEGADLDHNGRVDLEDFARFAQNCFRHPGI